MNTPRRVLIGTVGYSNLRDYSLGPKLFPRLKRMPWPEGVEVEEMNWGPVAIVHKFQALAVPYHRVVLVTARSAGRLPGTITLRRWEGGLPDEKTIQARISEAVTGVISPDNLLVVGEYFRIWPEEVFVVDVEPGIQEMGPEFTPEVREAIPRVLHLVRLVALEDLAVFPRWETLRGEELIVS